HRIGGCRLTLDARTQVRTADIAGSNQRIATQPPSVVPRNVQTVELLDELGRIAIEPLGERHHWGRIDRNCFATSSLLDASVPRADVLADVASIDHVTHLRAECLRNRRWRLAPVGET